MSKVKNWIKLEDWQKVNFPQVCPFTGLKPDTNKEYYIENTSVLWILLRLLRLTQYITIEVPFNLAGTNEIKKRRNKAILKGLTIGFAIAILALIIGVYLAVEAKSKQGYNLAIMISGCTFVASLVLGPVILATKEHNQSSPLYFKKKGKSLWISARNSDYRKKFILLNELNIMEATSTSDEILDD